MLAQAGLRQHFPNGLDLSGEQLSRPPRGYRPDDPDLPFLKLKSFGVSRLFTDAQVLAPDFLSQVLAGMLAARPWVGFLNQALG